MNKKLKVMHLIWAMGDGGAQRIVLNYLEDFKDDPDIEMKLFVYCGADESYCNRLIKDRDYPVVYLNSPKSRIKIPYIKKYFNNRIAKKVWKQTIREFQPDVVHVHISALLGNTINAIVEENVPLRFDTLHSDPMVYKGRRLKVNRRAFIKENFIPICVTKEQAIVAKKHYGFERYEVVYNGMDTYGIRSSIVHKQEARKKFNIKQTDFVVLGVGRLSSVKNFAFLIDVFALIAQKKDNAILVIAGDGEEMVNLKKKVNSLGIESKVFFLGNQDDIVSIYCAADVLGVTSITESSSLVTLEAQICGLRCVISNGVPDESIISDKVKKMSIKASLEDWAMALIDEEYRGVAISDESEYEVHAVSKKIKSIYFKYWNDFKNKN